MFIIDLSSSPLCDVELCVDLMEESGVSLIWDAFNQMLKLPLQSGSEFCLLWCPSRSRTDKQQHLQINIIIEHL